MDPRRLRFAAALTLFLLWVGALAVLAASSGRRPIPRPTSIAPR
jgi:hypothetical protein